MKCERRIPGGHPVPELPANERTHVADKVVKLNQQPQLPSRLIGDCARTVHEWNVFIALGLASSEKQIPQSVENIGNQNK
jgi:hypothetical protein